VHRALAEDRLVPLHEALARLTAESRRRNQLLAALLVVTGLAFAGVLFLVTL
jgi:hypothetical protein